MHQKSITLLVLLFLTGFFISPQFGYAQKSWKLDVEGNVRDEDSKEIMKGAKIEITKNGSPYKTIFADDNGNFSYSLEPDNSYTVKVSSGSYVSKIITISTENTPGDDEVKRILKPKLNLEFLNALKTSIIRFWIVPSAPSFLMQMKRSLITV